MSPGNLQARDLLLVVDRSRRGSLSRQIEEQLRTAIQSGALAAGEQLPSSRVLAEDLGVSRGVVMRAYGQLAAEGYLSLRQGAAPTARAPVLFGGATTRPPSSGTKIIYDLTPDLPEVATFPRQQWLRAVRESLEKARTADLTYGEPAGIWELRVEVANYLRRARGVLAHPERTLITTGSNHALSLVSRVLVRRDQVTMAFENPSHRLLRSVAATGGQAIVAAELDEGGIRPDSIKSVQSVVVAPAHQFPTGVSLGPERRTALIEWAEAANALILEDDYDAEFRYDRAQVGALQGLAPERVIYIGSTGKTFVPALRLGWVVLPVHLVEDVSQQLRNSMLFVSGLDQLAFTEFLRRGDFDRYLRRMRRVYRARRDLVVSLLAELLPDHEVRGIAAGLHVVLEMPSHEVAEAVRTDAEAVGIRIESLDEHAFADYAGGSGLLIGYGCLPEPTLERAIRALAEVINSALAVT
jgi:GntR family transcriptional regulator / MocR family aminotransferase